ncbi:MAG: HNH endonuclease [Verrucomicrobia bacterium]|nr:HNH endonuclease [Verrucomicrobiota bacterium]
MSSPITPALRELVARRAEFICEYCLVHERDLYSGGQVDHIISERQDGPTTPENLAFACAWCNRQKGSDIAAIDPATGQLVRLLNPRLDKWSEHLQLVGGRIEWRTAIGEATVRLLKMNDLHRIEERELLRAHGKCPSAAALRRIRGG